MSRPRYYWYHFVKTRIQRSGSDDGHALQDRLFEVAYEEARSETKKLPNGDLRLRAVDEILIRQIYTIEGEADQVGYEAKTVQRWINSFVNLTGKKYGF